MSKSIYNNYILYCIGYLITFIILSFIQPSGMPNEWLIYSGLISVIAFSIFYKIAIVSDTSLILLLIFFYQLLFSLLLRYLFTTQYGNFFGPNPIDSLYYHKIATILSELSFFEMITYLQDQRIELSDFGFPLFLGVIYKISGGAALGITTMLVTNCVLHTIGCYLLYLLCLTLTKSKELSHTILCIWGFQWIAIWLNSSGLKEQVFLPIIIYTMLCLYRFIQSHSMKHLSGFIIGTLLICLFRYFISLFFMISLFVIIITESKWINRNYIQLLMGVFFFFALFSSYLNYFVPNLPDLNSIAESRAISTSPIMKGLFILLAFITPFPKILDSAAIQNFYFTSFSILKISITLYFFHALYLVKRFHIRIFYPLISIIVFNILLCIVTGFHSNYRYLYCTMPFFLILSVWGCKMLSGNSKHRILSAYSFISILLLVTLNELK